MRLPEVNSAQKTKRNEAHRRDEIIVFGENEADICSFDAKIMAQGGRKGYRGGGGLQQTKI